VPYGFFIDLPCGAIAAASIGLYFRVPKVLKPTEATPKEKKMLQMDIPSFLLVLASVVCYLLAMQ
jgi:MFS transporter, DHA2 family, glioxin efflux transporter